MSSVNYIEYFIIFVALYILLAYTFMCQDLKNYISGLEMFVQVSVQILILLLSKKYTETPTTGGFETIFESNGVFGMVLKQRV